MLRGLSFRYQSREKYSCAKNHRLAQDSSEPKRLSKAQSSIYIEALEFTSCRCHPSTLLSVLRSSKNSTTFELLHRACSQLKSFSPEPAYQRLNIISTHRVMKFRSSSKDIKKLIAGMSKSCPSANKISPWPSYRPLNGPPQQQQQHNNAIAASGCTEILDPSLGTLGKLPAELRIEIYRLVAHDYTIPLNDPDYLHWFTNYRSAESLSLLLVSKQLHEEFKAVQEKYAWPTVLCFFVKGHLEVIMHAENALSLIDKNILLGRQINRLTIVTYAFGGCMEMFFMSQFLKALLAPPTTTNTKVGVNVLSDPPKPHHAQLTKLRVILVTTSWTTMRWLQSGNDDDLGAMCQSIMLKSDIDNEPRQRRFKNLEDLELCIRYKSRYSTEQYTFNFSRHSDRLYPCNWLEIPPATVHRRRKEHRHFRTWMLGKFDKR